MALMNDDELKDLKAVAADPATTADDFDEAIRRLTVLTS